MIERIILERYTVIPKSISYDVQGWTNAVGPGLVGTAETAGLSAVVSMEAGTACPLKRKQKRQPSITALKKTAKIVYWHLDDFYQKYLRASYAATIKHQQRNQPMDYFFEE